MNIADKVFHQTKWSNLILIKLMEMMSNVIFALVLIKILISREEQSISSLKIYGYVKCTCSGKTKSIFTSDSSFESHIRSEKHIKKILNNLYLFFAV